MTQSKAKIKKGDEVIIIAGKDKGKRGTVLQVHRQSAGAARVLVEGANMVKKHVKPNPQANQPGGIVDRESSIDISSVMLFDHTSNKGSRVGCRVLEDGRKVRYLKSTGDIVDADEG
jgi:large subunit ribosomal protein L24